MPSNISVQEPTPIVEGAIKYVRPFKATLKAERNTTLLWGDPVRVLAAPQDGKVRVRARETEGVIAEADLCDQSLLEVYFIEVGQGDSILVHTPADRWILIDAGVANAAQPTRKGAANFLRWKFQRELGQGPEAPIVLDSVVVTHPDTDHYAGLLNVLSGQLEPGGARVPIEIGTLYHNGIGRFAAAPRLGAMDPGEAAAFPAGNHSFAPKDTFLTELLDDWASFEARRSRFSKEFAAYVDVALASAKQVRRLSHADGYLPGYEEGGGLVVRVLGPIAEPLQGGGVGLRAFNGWGGAFDESATRNGHSLMLRLDYGGARILLGGDTNRAGQELLLCYQKPSEFQADVAKGFHHGSEDISTAFLRSVGARVTIFSSGDAEDYYHPRPAAVGAAARYGRESVDVRGDSVPPMVFCTELSRSVSLAPPAAVEVPAAEPGKVVQHAASTVRVRAEGGAKFSALDRDLLASGLVYGLVNVRTDGRHILCATLKERNGDFYTEVIKAGVDVLRTE